MSASVPLREAKGLLRKQLRSLRDALSPDERRERSRRIFQRLNSLPAYREACLILFYASFGSEVNTWGMMEEAQKCGKRVALPRVNEVSGGLSALEIRDLHRDLHAGYKGILEPQLDVSRQVREDEIGLIIVPGLAFDDRGYRLGYGKGYYDRFLFNFSRKVPSVGLAFDFQVVPALPVSPRDFPLGLIVTDERIIWREKPVASSGESSFQ
jgi:5-formyltetrahydrofolate cyclo-ligase